MRPTFGWRVLHSWWLLFSILGFGCLNGLGFLYIGLRARKPAWWIPGIGYLVAGPAFALFATNGGTEEEADTGLTMAWLVVWVASLVHACVINSAWLRWRAGYVPWHARPPEQYHGGADHLAPPPEPVGLPAGLAPPPEQYYGPGPAAPGSPVDVNTAGPELLAMLPGFDPERVRRVVAERHARHGFGSPEEFAAAANLAPHEFVRVRDLVVCTPTPPAPPSGGRILDV